MKNLEIVLKITFQFYNCDENALNFLNIIQKSACIFLAFFKKMEYQGYKKNAKKCQINYCNICEAKCCKYKKIHYITETIFLKDTKKDTKDTIKILIKGIQLSLRKFQNFKKSDSF